MARTVWTVTVGGQEHKVELAYNSITGLRRVRVDGRVVHRAREWFTSYRVMRAMPILEGRAQVWLVVLLSSYRYYLISDGMPVPNDRERARGIDTKQLLAKRDLQDLAYWLELGEHLGLWYFPRTGTMWQYQHRLIGTVKDRPLNIGLGVRGANNNPTLYISVRHAAVADPRDSGASIANDPRMSDVLPDSLRKRSQLHFTATEAVVALPYNYKKQPVDELVGRISAFSEIVASHTPAMASDCCEQCGSSDAVESVLVNNNLMRLCQNCVGKIADSGAEAQRAYRSAPHKLLRGIVGGLAASILTAPILAAIVLLLSRVGAFIGMGVFLAVLKAMDWAGTKRTLLSTIIAGLLCFPGVLLGTYLAFAWQARRLGYELSPANLAALVEMTLSSEVLGLTLLYAGFGVILATIQNWLAQRRYLSQFFQPKVELVPQAGIVCESRMARIGE